MTKKQTGVNDQNAEIAAAEATATPVTPETETVQAEGEEAAEEEASEGLEPEPENPEPLTDEELAEEEAPALNPEAKALLEAEYPVLRDHGSHNAAVSGLQTSPGYNPSKL